MYLRHALFLAGCSALSISLQARVSDAFLEAEATRFFRNPAFQASTVTVNRDGSAMAMIKRDGDREFLGIYNFVTGEGKQKITRAATSTYSFDWLDNENLLVCYISQEQYFAGLYVMEAETGELLEVGVPREEAGNAGRDVGAVTIRGFDRRVLVPFESLPYTEGVAIVQNQSTKPYRQLLRFDANRWSLKTIESEEVDVLQADFDLQGNYRLRALRGDNPDEGIFYHRAHDEAGWEKIDLPDWCLTYGFDPSGKQLYVTYPIDGKRVMQGFNVEANQLSGGLIQDPVYDIEPDLIRDPGNGAVLGIHYETDKPVIRYFDRNVAQVMNLIQRSFPDEVHRFIGLHPEGGIIFASWGDRCPYKISRLDLTTNALSLLGSSRPEINAADLGRMYPFSCDSRDGTTIRGYYTLPAGMAEKPEQPLPTVVLVHGGPRVRDYWEFNPEVQFYARLGYAVLQVNYRGSSGLYGANDLTLLDACRLGPTDVVDATRWAIEEGIVDPKRIAINGGSFGGYIALACAADEPDLYQCAVGVAGVYDFDRQIVEQMRDPTARDRMQWRQSYYGDLESNREEYQAISPLHRAEAVTIPVYLLHGGADETVFRSQSTRMERALKEAGVPVEIDTPVWYGHGARNEAQDIRYNQRIYRFIEKHLGAATKGG
jgi:dipeptidyl aminopeptidase/acylaminoacyl peptidase